MPRVCYFTGKKTSFGNQIETRGKAKYLGGVGTKVTGITKRTFKPNLQRVKVQGDDGKAATKRVCVQCIRSGRIRKAVRQKPFDLAKAEASMKK